jgi:Family of unknown function (DUF5335)
MPMGNGGHMPLIELARARWQPFFDGLSKSLRAQRVKIEVTGLGLGDRIAADWVALDGMSYDRKDDAVTIFSEGLRHQIRHPNRIHVDEQLDRVHSLELVDRDGDHHIVLLSDPLGLPGP